MGNSTTSKMIDERTIQFHSHDERITILQGVSHVLDSRYNLISLGALQGEGSSFNSESDLMKVFKEAHVKFQVECVGIVYMLRNSKVTIGGLQLSSTFQDQRL